MNKYKIAVLDDYQNVALESADWSVLRDRADITVFQNHLAEPDAVVERLLPFEVVCVMRERTPLPRNVIERLPNLKLIASTGPGNASIDVAGAGDHGIAVVHTGYRSDPTIEFTWALILASARHIVTESNSLRSGGWQQTVGTDLRGKTLGVLGLGRIGSQVARVGSAFGMNLIAWSQNLTPEAAKAAGANQDSCIAFGSANYNRIQIVNTPARVALMPRPKSRSGRSPSRMACAPSPSRRIPMDPPSACSFRYPICMASP
jgi:phosphoglycerate dehydrogenase-like enzyme